MGKLYFRPGTFAEEVDPADSPIQAASTSVSLLQGVLPRGPVNKVIGPFRSLPEFEAVYGEPEQTYKLWYYARGFFKNGGQELYINRIAHYSDITNAATRVGTVASRSLNTADGGATSGFLDGTAVAPFELTAGATLLVDTDNGGIETVTFDAAAASVTCSGTETYNLSGTETLTVKIDRGSTQTITFQAGDFAVGGAATAEEVAARLSSDLSGAAVAVVGGNTVKITSDTLGTGSYVQVTGGTANSELSFSTSESQGTGDVASIAAVTYAEAKTVIENDTTGLTVSQLGSGALRLTSDTTGTSSEVDISGGTGRVALGFSIDVNAGAASSVNATLKLEFGWKGYDSPGTYPNGHLKTHVYKNPLHPSAGAGSDVAVDTGATPTVIKVVSLQGIKAGSIMKISGGGNTEYFQVLRVASAIESGTLRHNVYPTAALTNAYTAAAATLESREFTIDVYWDDVLVEEWDELNMLDTHDTYVETVLNDESTGSLYLYATDLDAANGLGADIPADDAASTAMSVAGTAEFTGLTATDYIGYETNNLGIHAADEVAILIDQVAYPGYTDATALHDLSQWCADKMFIFPTFAMPIGTLPSAAASYRNSTFALFSKYGSLEYPALKVYDPLSSATRPMLTLTPEAHIMGLRARVDGLPGENDGGVWASAMGEGTFGQLLDVMDVEYNLTDTQHEALHPSSINCIRVYDGLFQRFGARTCSNDLDWRYESVVRFFMFVEKSVVRGTRWAVGRNNNFRLWRRLENRVDEFCEVLQAKNAFPGANKAENWFVKVGEDQGVQTSLDTDNGYCIGEIGLAPSKPAEFIIFRFSQFKSGGFAVEEL